MKVEMIMPQMGESITEATIIKWYKNVGETVEKDETILEISTDKVDSEIPAPASGVVTKLLANQDDVVEVGNVIALIETDANAAKIEEKEAPPPPKSQPEPPKKEETPPPPKPEPPAKPEDDFRFYSPLVKRIAAEEGISDEELENIVGTGDRGRVTKKDITQYLAERKEKPAPATPTPPTPATPSAPSPKTTPSGRVEVVEMDNMRKMIAKHMVASMQTSPHVTVTTEADMTHLVAFREKHKAAFEQREGAKFTYTPIIAHAVINALREFTWVNSSVEEDRILVKKYINLGIAVALPSAGLIVPVIKNADQLNLRGLALASYDLATRAREKKLTPNEVTDGTFTITNMGVFGSLTGTPIINQPQLAILAVGAIKKRPVVVSHPQYGDSIAIRSMMYLTLSFDHRLIDGAMGGQFLERIVYYLENFDTNQTI